MVMYGLAAEIPREAYNSAIIAVVFSILDGSVLFLEPSSTIYVINSD